MHPLSLTSSYLCEGTKHRVGKNCTQSALGAACRLLCFLRKAVSAIYRMLNTDALISWRKCKRIFHFNFKATLWGRYHYDLYSTIDAIEAQMGDLPKVTPPAGMPVTQFSVWPLGDTQEETDIDVIVSVTEGEVLLNMHSFLQCSSGFH